MAIKDGQTTLVCLFHTADRTKDALRDLSEAGVSKTAIRTIDASQSSGAKLTAEDLASWKVPDRDAEMFSNGLRNGGSIIVVSATEELADKVEEIFERNQARKVDEEVIRDKVAAPVAAAAASVAKGAAIPVLEEELVVSKRAVARGGVRVYSHIVEKPVEQTVELREEHVTIERHAVDRAISPADLAAQDGKTIEVTESAEIPVVSKTARVVEEISVGKETTERTQKVTDTVRRTEIEIEKLEPKGKLNK